MLAFKFAIFSLLCVLPFSSALIARTSTSPILYPRLNGSLNYPPPIAGPPFAVNPFPFPRRWPPAPFTYQAERDVLLHFEYYEPHNIASAMETGLRTIISGPFSHWIMSRDLGPEERVPEVRIRFAAPKTDGAGRPLVGIPNLEVEINNNPDQIFAPYTVQAMQATLYGILKKVRTSKVGHYALVKPVIRGVTYRRVRIEQRSEETLE